MPVPVNTNAQVQALIDAFLVKGGYRLTLDEVVVPVAVVAELAGTEHPAAWAGNYRTAVNRQTFSLYNPAASPVDLYIDLVRWSQSATGQVRVGYFGTTLANADPVAFRDLRNPNPPQGQFRWADLAAAPVGGNLMEAFRLNGGAMIVPLPYDPPIILGPGQQYWIQCETAGATFGVGMLWREVPR